MKIFLSLLIAILYSFSLLAQTPEIEILSQELQKRDGKFFFLPDEIKKMIRQSTIDDIDHDVLVSVTNFTYNNLPSNEFFGGLKKVAFEILNSSGEVVGHIVFPWNYMPVEEGDSDYYVIYYIFLSKDGERETYFKVYDPLF